MSNSIDSTHDAYVSLLAGRVKYASTGGRIELHAMSMGKRIKTLREAKGLSQQQLADQLGVSRAAVSLWELDATKNIKNVTMLALCQILGTTQEYLLFGPQSERGDSTGRFRAPRLSGNEKP